MADKISVKIILPSLVAFEIDADMVNIPGMDGMFGVLSGHANFVSNIKIGTVSIFNDGQEIKYFVYGGIAKVTGQEVKIITEFASDIRKVSKTDLYNEINNFHDLLALEKDDDSIESIVIKMKLARSEAMLGFVG